MSIIQLPLKGVFIDERKKRLFTQNLLPGKQAFDEELVSHGGKEYRNWNPRRSKLAAAILAGISQIAIRPGSSVLYLGIAHGYTASFISDIIGSEGFLFGVDNAPAVLRDAVLLCMQRTNMTAILADAARPETYASRILPVDVLYQDIAQRDQAGIFLSNLRLFVKPGGFGLLALKARSVNVARKPREIFQETRVQLEQEAAVVDYRELEPWQRDHCFFVCKKT